MQVEITASSFSAVIVNLAWIEYIHSELNIELMDWSID